MARCLLFVLCVILSCSSAYDKNQRECERNRRDPPFLRTLDVERLRGPWFGNRFKPGELESPEIPLEAFTHEYVVVGKVSEIRVSGRQFRIDRENCLYETAKQFQIGNSGRFSYTSNLRYKGQILDFRVIALNNTLKYMIRWACIQYKDGECSDYELAAWNRERKPFTGQARMDIARIIRDVFCLDAFDDNDLLDVLKFTFCPERPAQIIKTPLPLETSASSQESSTQPPKRSRSERRSFRRRGKYDR